MATEIFLQDATHFETRPHCAELKSIGGCCFDYNDDLTKCDNGNVSSCWVRLN